MRSFESITRQLDRWRQLRVPSPRDRAASPQEKRRSPQPWPWQRPPKGPPANGAASTARNGKAATPAAIVKAAARREPGPPSGKPSGRASQRADLLLWAVATVSLTGAMSQPFLNQPKLDVGTIAPKDITAPHAATIVDDRSTEAKRQDARRGITPVLAIDAEANRSIDDALQAVLDRGDELRGYAGVFPYANTGILSTRTQQFLRSIGAASWARIENIFRPTNIPPGPGDRPENLAAKRQAIRELQSYRQRASDAEFEALLASISAARQRYVNAKGVLAGMKSTEDGLPYDERLFDLSDETWQQTQRGLESALFRMLTQGIPQGLPEAVVERAALAQVESDVPLKARNLAATVLSSVLSQQSNLVQDADETRKRAEKAAEDVPAVTVSAKKGDLVVAAGDEIQPGQFALLDHYGLSRRGINVRGLLGLAGVVAIATGAFWFVERRARYRLRRRDRVLLLLLSLSTPLLVTVTTALPGGQGTTLVAAANLPAVGLLAGSFYGSSIGAGVVVLLTAVLPVGLNLELSYLLANAAGGLLAAAVAGRLRSREELAFLGAGVGLAQAIVYLIVNLIPSAAAGSVWSAVLAASALYGLAGLAWSVVALGISPYLEHLFDLVTPIRLAELSNPNRPLLKRLASQAPGTFQHTLFVASLAEAAARVLGCNVELVRAGTLYHDIGKMHDPMGFIENQMGGPNKHDEIDNPWKSAEIIKKHVSEGLVMARRCRLPKAVQAFIPEHQGTMLIAYFYHQAKQREAAWRAAQADARDASPLESRSERSNGYITQVKSPAACRPVREGDFRYPGPIPQSRETGIVMLADSCEAALRSLKDATYEEAIAMTNKILRARWQDNQLVDSGLTREEMGRIAEVFVRVWQQFNHQRIAYPQAVLSNK